MRRDLDVATRAYAEARARKTNSTRRWLAPSGPVGPMRVLIDSRTAQIATHSSSTEPKNNGARVSDVTVSQSWIDLQVSTGNLDRSRRFIAGAPDSTFASYQRVRLRMFEPKTLKKKSRPG